MQNESLACSGVAWQVAGRGDHRADAEVLGQRGAACAGRGRDLLAGSWAPVRRRSARCSAAAFHRGDRPDRQARPAPGTAARLMPHLPVRPRDLDQGCPIVAFLPAWPAPAVE
jgi:hypothetical protein